MTLVINQQRMIYLTFSSTILSNLRYQSSTVQLMETQTKQHIDSHSISDFQVRHCSSETVTNKYPSELYIALSDEPPYLVLMTAT